MPSRGNCGRLIRWPSTHHETFSVDRCHGARSSMSAGCMPRLTLSRRYSRWVLVFVLAGTIWLVKKLVDIYHSLPPLYSQYHWQEMALPQHSEHLPYPDDDTRKFLWMSDHVRGYGKQLHHRENFVLVFLPDRLSTGAGWGNVLQEHFMDGYLAYVSKRS